MKNRFCDHMHEHVVKTRHSFSDWNWTEDSWITWTSNLLGHRTGMCDQILIALLSGSSLGLVFCNNGFKEKVGRICVWLLKCSWWQLNQEFGRCSYQISCERETHRRWERESRRGSNFGLARWLKSSREITHHIFQLLSIRTGDDFRQKRCTWLPE